MKSRITAGAGMALVAAAGVFVFVGATSDSGESDGESSGGVVAPSAPADEAKATLVHAEPGGEDDQRDLVLNAPAEVEPGQEATFGGTWRTDEGEGISGEADLQRLDGKTWTTVTSISFDDGSGEADVTVESSGLYRLAYGGSDEVEAATSTDLAVHAGEPLKSRLTTTVESTDDDAVEVTAAWTTEGGVPIAGDLGLQQAADDEWEDVSNAVTGAEGTAVAEVDAGETSEFRFTYTGGSRFGEVASDAAVALGDDVQTIPVEVCEDAADVDALDHGVGCHYKPVSSGTFVSAHDYLGNAWWNSIPIGNYVELTGEFAGLYEVVDREIAPGRGAALGPASDWACGDACDIVLQTCQGKNTGFTWLSKVGDP